GVTHVPEVRGAALEFSMGPCAPDAVMMDVVGRVIVSDHFARRRVDGMQIAAALEHLFDVGTGQSAGAGFIIEQRTARRSAVDWTHERKLKFRSEERRVG